MLLNIKLNIFLKYTMINTLNTYHKKDILKELNTKPRKNRSFTNHNNNSMLNQHTLNHNMFNQLMFNHNNMFNQLTKHQLTIPNQWQHHTLLPNHTHMLNQFNQSQELTWQVLQLKSHNKHLPQQPISNHLNKKKTKELRINNNKIKNENLFE